MDKNVNRSKFIMYQICDILNKMLSSYELDEIGIIYLKKLVEMGFIALNSVKSC